MSKYSNVLGLLAGGVGVGYGAYFLSQSGEIRKIEKEEKEASRLVENESKNLLIINKSLQEQETRQRELSEKIPSSQKAVEAAAASVEKARAHLQLLEQEYNTKQAEATKVINDLDSVMSRIESLRRDSDRAAGAVTLGQKSLAIAQQQRTDAKKLLNPLNHPRVKSLLSKH
ncbi:hypothetical protein CEUSTIGMA_g11722.t1 [Chlamydomonas eustigma]|uniref:Uncharacterized protein n=1 Tax=Chlamydomonas eustigma TaxID=1157962 RepID=A0A250XNB5_9CHLO|nr:hypothetical protein CEUSTIGMA_g11722.t1 [Chlamydomonas eustigma]|eukprot:GAX84300.1 hypothetical protein CEUSTIGMA_g11722.t1 [Chlamydomonas eustigma]